MADNPDKTVQRMVELLEMADQAGSESSGQTKSTKETLIKDINDLSNQISLKSVEVTAPFIQTASKEQLYEKKSEFKTLVELYMGKMVELSKETLPEVIQKQLKQNRDEVEKIVKRVDAMFATSKYEIANQLYTTLLETYTKLKEIRAVLTAEYMHTASMDSLASVRSDVSELFSSFKEKYRQIVLDDLAPEERHKLIQYKADVETASEIVDRFIERELLRKADDNKALGQLGEVAPTGEDTLLGSTQNPNHLQQIDELNQRVNQLLTQGQAATEKLQAMEKRLTYHDDLASSGEIYDDLDNPMVGDQMATGDQTVGIAGVKVGSIELPLFSGRLEEWEAFKDLFEHLIHDSKKMSKTVKFTQLRTHLSGEALNTIRGYRVTGTNYDAAWADLCKRYDRTDELVDEYIRKFFESRPVEGKPNYTTLRRIIDFTNQMLRALPNLGEDISHWDPIVNLIICSKLTEELRTEWAQRKVRDGKKTTTHLLSLLEDRAIELQPKQSDRLSQMLKGENRMTKSPPKRVVFQISEKKPESKKEKVAKQCPICKGNHRIWDCNMLKKESAKARTGIIRTLGLCFKCLLEHRAGLCDEEDCEYCGGPHNIMLCYKRDNEEKMKPFRARGAQNPSERIPGGPKPSTSRQIDEGDPWNSAVQKN